MGSTSPIDEIRELRKRISERLDNDPAKVVAYYSKLQEQYGERLIRSTADRDRKEYEAV